MTGYKKFFQALFIFCILSCSATKEKNNPQLNELSLKQLNSTIQEQNQEQLDQYLNKWFYGQGLGQSMTNIGTAVIFPPYALYLLGNAGIVLAGFEPLYLSSALPEESKEIVLQPYKSLTSLPGRITSTLAGRDFNE